MNIKFFLLTILMVLVTNVYSKNDYPNKPLRFLVPAAVGGGADIVARIAANQLMYDLKENVVVDNRGGAGGILAFETLLNAPADGYTIIVMSNGAQEEMFAKNPLKEITTIARQPITLSINTQVPASSVKEFVSLAKSNPGLLKYGSGGVGSVIEAASKDFEKIAHVSFIHVPYRGGATAIIPVISGETQIIFTGVAPMLPFKNKVKMLAVTGPKRSSLIPDVPTFTEQGYPNYDYHVWYSLVVHKNVPKEIDLLLNKSIHNINEEQFTRIGIEKWTIKR